ncbi:26513_t:CDS:1, partial [Racocetra persica]
MSERNVKYCDINEFTDLKKIHEGKFGYVSKVKLKSGITVAIKFSNNIKIFDNIQTFEMMQK